MSDLDLGKHWAAIKGSKVIVTLSMTVPDDTDFIEYRDKARACLAVVGDVRTGRVVERKGDRYFIQDLSHPNRGKKKREPKIFWLYRPKPVDNPDK